MVARRGNRIYAGGYRRSVSSMIARNRSSCRRSSARGGRAPATRSMSSRILSNTSGCWLRRWLAQDSVALVVSWPAINRVMTSSRTATGSALPPSISVDSRSPRSSAGAASRAETMPVTRRLHRRRGLPLTRLYRQWRPIRDSNRIGRFPKRYLGKRGDRFTHCDGLLSQCFAKQRVRCDVERQLYHLAIGVERNRVSLCGALPCGTQSKCPVLRSCLRSLANAGWRTRPGLAGAWCAIARLPRSAGWLHSTGPARA